MHDDSVGDLKLNRLSPLPNEISVSANPEVLELRNSASATFLLIL